MVDKAVGTDVRFGTNITIHMRNLRDAVKAFLYDATVPADFADLLVFIDKRFRRCDDQMFREWIDKEFPGKFTSQ